MEWINELRLCWFGKLSQNRKKRRLTTLCQDITSRLKSENSESVKQYARIVWASLISSLEVVRYGYLPHPFSLTFQPPQFSVENKKGSKFQLVFEPVIFLTLFLFWLFLFHDSPLAGNTRSPFETFLLFNSVTSAVTAYNVGVFKKTSSFLFSKKVKLMLLLAILNKLKSFRWHFLMFANSSIYWNLELLQHVNMKRNNKCY